MNAIERKTEFRALAVCLVLLLGASATRAASTVIIAGPDSTNTLTLTKTAEYSFEKDGCGGIAWSGHAGVFYVLRDHDGDKTKIYPLALRIDPDTGAILDQTLGASFSPGSLADGEGIALDPQSGRLWVSDEGKYDQSNDNFVPPTIGEYNLDGTATKRIAPVPAIQNKHRNNRSLEALTVSPDGLTMWTANEQALTCDGESSDGNTNVSTVVRLTRFTRETPQANWEAAGEWAYACDPCAMANHAQSGLSGLCALPDGSLLTLEREVSAMTFGRCRIYRITTGAFASATEVSACSALTNATVNAVSKGTKPLLSFNGPFSLFGPYEVIVYEGIALGPILNDGSRAVYLVSDGGASIPATVPIFGEIKVDALSRLCALKLTGLGEAPPGVPPFLDWPEEPDTQITDAMGPIDLGLVAGAFADAATTTAELRKLSKWANTNSVPYAGAGVNAMAFDANGNPETDLSTAYLLDCGVGDLAARKAAFRFTEFTPGTVPSITGSFNGTVQVLGTDDLSGEWAPATADHHFFRAILTR